MRRQLAVAIGVLVLLFWVAVAALASGSFAGTPDEQRLAKVVHTLEAYFHLLVREGQLAEATTIVERLKGTSPETDSVPGRTLERMADADRLALSTRRWR